MDKPKTLEEALQLVPEYILLRPGVDVWREAMAAIILQEDYGLSGKIKLLRNWLLFSE